MLEVWFDSRIFLINFLNKTEMKLNWNLFDKIFCIHYLPYNDRLHNIKKELNRVHILNSSNFEFYYTVPNNYYNYIFLSHKNFKDIRNTIYSRMLDKNIDINTPEATNSDIDFRLINNTNINYTINTLDILYQIQMRKYKKVLILEDDIFFLKNIKIIKKYLDNIPENFDIINFDPFLYDLNEYKVMSYYDCYYNTLKTQFYNGSCIALSDKAVSFILDCQDKMVLPYDNYLTYKGMPNDDLLRFIPNKNLCIQRDYNLRQEYYYQNNKDSKYKYMNIDEKDYNELESI